MTNANKDLFKHGKFDVEHALDIHATSYGTFPAQALYDEAFVNKIRESSQSLHIYLIGYTPKMQIDTPRFGDGVLTISILYMGKSVELKFDVPAHFKFVQDGDECHFEDEQGRHRWLDSLTIMRKLSVAVDGCPFLIKYIGQAYGEDGSRDAIDRLLKHETLQKIAIKGIPEGSTLQVILLELLDANRMVTVFLPDADHQDDDGTRRKMGLDKLFNTSEAERVSLYEASLIRHFAPEFNKEFKNSFPSTNLKVLRDCYAKDILAVTAEICFDDFPFRLHSEAVPPSLYHIITHDLHKDDDRKVFFAMSQKPKTDAGSSK